MSGFKIVFGLLACVLLVSAFETDIVGDNYIIGGRNANRYQFPWIVSLRNRQNNHFCGGFILSNRWIGSAAQCTLGNHAIPDNVIAATGAHTRTDGTRHRINRILNHPRFNRVTLTFDVSILQTADRIAVTPNGPIRAIRFPTGQVVHNGATVYIAGWGRAQVRDFFAKTFDSVSDKFLLFFSSIVIIVGIKNARSRCTTNSAMDRNPDHASATMPTETWQ